MKTVLGMFRLRAGYFARGGKVTKTPPGATRQRSFQPPAGASTPMRVPPDPPENDGRASIGVFRVFPAHWDYDPFPLLRRCRSGSGY